jgi:hypothetical protein
MKVKSQNVKVKTTIQKSKVKAEFINIKFFLKLFTFYFLLFTFFGCDAFVRKFTRKPKKEAAPQGEMVLAPEEYKGPQMTKEESYRQYFLFWKSWQDELLTSLLEKRSQKKQIDCAKEAIKNLVNLKALLNEGKQKKLDMYIKRLEDLRDLISQDLYGSNIITYFHEAERIRRDILRDFSYHKISKDIT